MRITLTSAALMRGFWRMPSGMAARQVGHDSLFCCTHLVKQVRQKLCWQGACASAAQGLAHADKMHAVGGPRRAPSPGARTG
jgi:hypothetical protein